MYKKLDYNTEDLDNIKISELKRIADYWLRKFLLCTTHRNGYGQIYCPLKNKWYNEDKMQASHYIDRSCMATRYDLDNVHLISSVSNMWDAQEQVEGYKSKHHKEYSKFLGEKKVQTLLQKSKKNCIFARKDYIYIIVKFREGCQKTSTHL